MTKHTDLLQVLTLLDCSSLCCPSTDFPPAT